ncbi:TCR/Tet family MFS transporter [Niabella drilacis]|uniref:MFS transporter, DHA1 family, tetracycline resistance protein n=1 Tax=Niabella drilacis (strain DSM 25811 / CCM 8410 / CCUG 62505 / LMG 26954 / E90) TaxID=1285928 RepID=A0A1G6PUZ9_NIADE|nr:TCR/Tet family MFS transporter [Niabella drilacis]SDC83185.1 MFS transporter, DHA1 family, tetracycline resistance protein [Niabella drilacis]
MKQSRNAAIGFIFITMTIDVIGFGLIIPVMPKLIAELKHISISEASIYGGDLLALYAVMQLLFSPFMGNLSDRFGRRPVLLLSLLGFCFDYLILAFAHTYSLLVVGRILSGITGASFTTATAYIADISTNENRAKNFGLIGAAFGLGFVIGPALGGLLSVWGLRAPFFAAAGLCLLNFLYGYFVLPESLKPENRRPFNWLKANPVGSLLLFLKYPGILGLVLCFFFIFLGGHAVQSNWSYFTMDQFKWSEKEVGISLAIVGVLVGVVQGVLIRYTSPRLGNEKSAYTGLFFYAFGMILFAFATRSWMMYAFLVPYCMGGIAGPALQALITNQVPANEQGALQGGLNCIMSLTSIIGPLMMTRTFYFFSHEQAPVYFPGAPFVLGAALMLISAVMAYYMLHVKKKRAPVS